MIAEGPAFPVDVQKSVRLILLLGKLRVAGLRQKSVPFMLNALTNMNAPVSKMVVQLAVVSLSHNYLCGCAYKDADQEFKDAVEKLS